MKFEEQFPSLDKCEWITDRDMGDIKMGYEKQDIMEFCLDKQRVREALKDTLDRYSEEEGWMDSYSCGDQILELKNTIKNILSDIENDLKELGL